MEEITKQILYTKISIPPLRNDEISRPRILKKLESPLMSRKGAVPQLILVSAPAGYGKTTLVCQWLTYQKRLSAWFFLDSHDNEPQRFWAYLIYALQRVERGLGQKTLEMLHSFTPFSETPMGDGALLTPLLNDLFQLETPIDLVIDDYHHIENPRIHEGMTFFIDHIPPNFHLVVVTRTDPPWPLSRWRSKGRLVEMQPSDLKFTRDEMIRFIKKRVENPLSEKECGDLYKKTEGWVTAVQLVIHSLNHTSNTREFISRLTGDHQQIFHFLTEEVFSQQPTVVQEFLMKTSLLSRLSPSLCDSVTGGENSREMIDWLDRENLFIICLDERREWYRYHHLFGELLYYYLQRRYADALNGLHNQAGEWFLGAGEIGEAIRHFIQGEQYERVAKLICASFDSLWEEEGMAHLLEWLSLLPKKLYHIYPGLFVYQALILLLVGRLEEARHSLDLAGEIQQQQEEGEKEYRGMLAVVETLFHIFSGDLPTALENAEEALQSLPESAYFWRISAAILYGDVKVFSGELESAYQAFKDAYRWSKQRDTYQNFFITVSAAMNILKVLWMQGDFFEARQFSKELLALAKKNGFSNMPGMGIVWLFLGETFREEGHLEEALRCAIRGTSICASEKLVAGISYIFQAMTYFSKGDYGEGLKILGQLEILERETEVPEMVFQLLISWKVRVLLEKREIFEARQLLNVLNTHTLDTLFFPGNPLLVYIRLLLMENRLEEAQERITYIQSLPQYKQSRRLMINTLLLHTYGKELLGEKGAAEESLAHALCLGKEKGFYQIYIDEGRIAAPVFYRMLKRGGRSFFPNDGSGMKEFIQYICKGFQLAGPDKEGGMDVGDRHLDMERISQEMEYETLVEDLTPRELEVLDLLSRGLSNGDISQKLFLSLPTVKWHNSNIFGKLGVKNRTQAVTRARELGFFS